MSTKSKVVSRPEGQSLDSLPMPRRKQVPKRKDRPGVDRRGRTPLWRAAFKGDLVTILRELANGADPNGGDDDGFTPLHIAAEWGQPAAVEVLLARGADPNRVDHYGNGPVWTAAQRASIVAGTARHVAVLALLIGAGADLAAKNRYGHSTRALLRDCGLRWIVDFCAPAGRQARRTNG